MSSPAIGPADLDPCPYCGGTSGVQVITDTPPKVQGWSCAACGGQWWISVVNPHPFLDHLTATVELAAARSVLRQVIALADEASALSDDQLRARLVDLAGAARTCQQPAGCGPTPTSCHPATSGLGWRSTACSA